MASGSWMMMRRICGQTDLRQSANSRSYDVWGRGLKSFCPQHAYSHGAHFQDQLRRFPVQVLIEMCSWVVFYFGHVFSSKTLAQITYVLPTLLFLEEAWFGQGSTCIRPLIGPYKSIYNYSRGPPCSILL